MRIREKLPVFIIALVNAYKDKEEREDFSKLELKKEELTEDFTAMLVALLYVYRQITGDDTDLVNFTHILNRLAVQYIMDDEERKGDEE